MFSCFLLVPALVPALVFKQWIWNCAWRSWKHGFLLFGVYAGVIMMSSFVDRVFQHCLGSTRGKEVYSNSQGLKSRQTIIFCFHFYHLPQQTVSPAANPSRMLNTSQYQPSFVHPFVYDLLGVSFNFVSFDFVACGRGCSGGCLAGWFPTNLPRIRNSWFHLLTAKKASVLLLLTNKEFSLQPRIWNYFVFSFECVYFSIVLEGQFWMLFCNPHLHGLYLIVAVGVFFSIRISQTIFLACFGSDFKTPSIDGSNQVIASQTKWITELIERYQKVLGGQRLRVRRSLFDPGCETTSSSRFHNLLLQNLD